MVSIIPGMEMAPPERTERSNGRAGSPKRLPVAVSRVSRAVSTSSQRFEGGSPVAE